MRKLESYEFVGLTKRQLEKYENALLAPPKDMLFRSDFNARYLKIARGLSYKEAVQNFIQRFPRFVGEGRVYKSQDGKTIRLDTFFSTRELKEIVDKAITSIEQPTT